MLEFKKYSSIENSFSREFMEHVVAEMPQDLEYVVQEKVHGANTSFLCDGETVRFAKRTSMLEDGEQFYDYPELLERYRDRVLKLFGGIKAKYSEVTHISVFGEMFGGLYPHDGVKAKLKVGLILNDCVMRHLRRPVARGDFHLTRPDLKCICGKSVHI